MALRFKTASSWTAWTRYRRLRKTRGYPVSTPVPEFVKAAYGFESMPLEDSDLIVFAMFRKSRKEFLINEYIRNCMEYMTMLNKKRGA